VLKFSLLRGVVKNVNKLVFDQLPKKETTTLMPNFIITRF